MGHTNFCKTAGRGLRPHWLLVCWPTREMDEGGQRGDRKNVLPLCPPSCSAHRGSLTRGFLEGRAGTGWGSKPSAAGQGQGGTAAHLLLPGLRCIRGKKGGSALTMKAHSGHMN